MLPLSAVRRLEIGIVIGAVVGLVVGVVAGLLLGVLVGIAATGTSTVVAGWVVLWPMDATATRANVQREDFRPVAEEIVIVVAALGGLVAIVVLLLLSRSQSGQMAAAAAPVGVATVWAVIHRTYAGRLIRRHSCGCKPVPPACADRGGHQGGRAVAHLPLDIAHGEAAGTPAA